MSGCTDAELEIEQVLEPASIQVSWDDLHELVEAFGYEQGIRQFCEDSTAASQDVFLAELSKLKGFEAKMLERVKIRAGEVQAEFDQADPQEEQEYICTVEMHASSEDRADLAREKWAEIKDLVNE
ncbi:MAG: hypothetical protein ABJH52_10145 [Henriciella sp.]